MRNNPTEAELLLWLCLRNRQLAGCKFRRQQPVGEYIVDFLCWEKRLIVEVDGSQHGESSAADKERTEWLESQGFRVLRFWNNEVKGNLEGVTLAILATLDESTNA